MRVTKVRGRLLQFGGLWHVVESCESYLVYVNVLIAQMSLSSVGTEVRSRAPSNELGS